MPRCGKLLCTVLVPILDCTLCTPRRLICRGAQHRLAEHARNYCTGSTALYHGTIDH